MRLFYPDHKASQGWLAGPWNSELSGAIGYTRVAREEPHYHARMREACVVTSGSGELMVAGRTQRVETGVLVIVEPGEVHAWQSASRDFHMLILHEPWLPDDTVVVAQA